MRSEISFVLDGRLVSIDFNGSGGAKPTTTILQYLRSLPNHKGAKEGCAEGDCGACSVVLGELATDGSLRYQAVNACLVFLPRLHGKHLITVENLALDGGELHPVQQAMVETSGSQCGYCTPGIVMSMYSLYTNVSSPSSAEIDDALAGNLCRCTGYKPIVEAAERSCAHKREDGVSADANSIRKILESIPHQSIHIETTRQEYFQPISLEEALDLRSTFPDANVICGSTDVALRVTKKHELISRIIDLSAIAELQQIIRNDQALRIGAGVSMSAIMPDMQETYPALHEMLCVFGSRQIRNVATLGGNLGTASPVGDTLPVLMAFNAMVVLQGKSGAREVSIHDFIRGYRTTDCRPDELIVAVILPKHTNGVLVKSYKISKRKDVDISTVSAGFRLELNGNKRVKSITLAYGGMADRTKRAATAEKFLSGKLWNRETVESAMKFVDEDFSPISDVRGSAEFRRIAARNLLLKFWSETK